MNDYFDHDEKPSKSARKREMTALQNLGEQLTHLTMKQLQSLMLPPDLLKAVIATHVMPKKDVRKRQVQFIGRLMRELDVETINKIQKYFKNS